MLLKKISSRKNGMALIEYATLFTVVVGAIALASVYYKRGLQGKMAALTDHFIGTEQEGGFVPMNASGSRQLVEPGGVYQLSGMTTTYSENTVRQQGGEDGSRSLTMEGWETKQSPGGRISGGEYGWSFDPLNEFKYEDPDKAPVYVPKFIKAEDGYIDPPRRD
ncbi:MAG: hypothetical protein PHS09_03760 [Candidatus Omnitrophica bacterium]|nr:hypothetical protein [Candidatus Omnitrophota bacterium]MDD5512964.1 hypothetical protein [Candidatus Omnitrophota bacterium]